MDTERDRRAADVAATLAYCREVQAAAHSIRAMSRATRELAKKVVQANRERDRLRRKSVAPLTDLGASRPPPPPRTLALGLSGDVLHFTCLPLALLVDAAGVGAPGIWLLPRT